MSEVRVRFAPSPTGRIHMGNARAALFNHLWARRHGGKFILRLEDTDLERNIPGSAEGIVQDLEWLGVRIDEGPYRQSERLERYRLHAQALRTQGMAYPCFCKQEETEAEPEEGEVPSWSRADRCPCRSLDATETARRLAAAPAALRLRTGGRVFGFTDLAVKRRVEKAVEDFVILKSDGFPTFHFAVVVDDHEMRISHVVRGAGHRDNTAKHIAIYQALGWEPPAFSHYSFTLGLGKRKGSTSIKDYRDQGYLPEAVANYCLLLGWLPPDGREKFRMDEVIEVFDIKDFNTADSHFDQQKFEWLAGQYLREAALERVCREARPFLEKASIAVPAGGVAYSAGSMKALERDRFMAILEEARGRVHRLADLLREMQLYLDDEVTLDDDARAALREPSAAAVLSAAAELLAAGAGELGPEEAAALPKAVQQETGIKGKPLYTALRAALLGKTQGAEIAHALPLLGRERAITRLRAACRSSD